MVDYLHGVHSLGWYGFWFAVIPLFVLVILCAVGVVFLGDTLLEGLGFAVIPVLLAATIGVIAGISYWPFNETYHKWYPVTGTVAEVNQRLISDGNKGMSQRYVIRFRESGELFGCDDTRCALATSGKYLALKCKKEYVFQSDSGWACNYNQKD